MDTKNNPFEHILYEINMFLYTCLANIPEGIPDRQLFMNLIVDSRAIHLRNLGEFFKEKKEGKNWHFSDFVDSNNGIHIIDKDLFSRIKRYTSQATCHLSNERLRNTFKNETLNCVNEAFQQIILSINSFFRALESEVKDEYKQQWENEEIQAFTKYITQQMTLINKQKYQYFCYTTE